MQLLTISVPSPLLVLGPPARSREVITILNMEIQSILQEPKVRATYASSGADPVFGSPEEVAALIKREIEINGKMVKELGVSMEL
jgi:tripartite-type tricarboxylate transporter receptor subunit TctC